MCCLQASSLSIPHPLLQNHIAMLFQWAWPRMSVGLLNNSPGECHGQLFSPPSLPPNAKRFQRLKCSQDILWLRAYEGPWKILSKWTRRIKENGPNPGWTYNLRFPIYFQKSWKQFPVWGPQQQRCKPIVKGLCSDLASPWALSHLKSTAKAVDSTELKAQTRELTPPFHVVKVTCNQAAQIQGNALTQQQQPPLLLLTHLWDCRQSVSRSPSQISQTQAQINPD